MDQLLLDCATNLLNKNNIIAVIELYRKAKFYIQAAELILKVRFLKIYHLKSLHRLQSFLKDCP